ncbi:MAG: AAA family ATPase [Rhodopirellula sp.]|nr:AAA family ATPase [Rhodopirellula sp.]
MATEDATTWIVEDCIVAGQGAVVAGPKKTLKSSLSVELALSLATGQPFLDRFIVPEPKRVGLISGEGARSTIRETIQRIGEFRRIDPMSVDNFFVTKGTPTFGDAECMRAVRSWIETYDIQVAVFDPLYLMLRQDTATQASNLFVMGAAFRELTWLCAERQVTPIIVHHTGKKAALNRPAELEDLAWAGIQEWARQWILLARRSPYVPGSGEHQLWLTLGGSAGHSSQWRLDVSEGVLSAESPRWWRSTVTGHQAEEGSLSSRPASPRANVQQLAEDKQRILDTISAGPNTKTGIQRQTGLGNSRFTRAWGGLLADGVIGQDVAISRNSHSYPSWCVL